MIKQYKKKPFVIDAMQFIPAQESETTKFTEGKLVYHETSNQYYIETMEGMMEVYKYDYIIKGIKGEFYAVDKDIFEESYEEVEE